MDSLQRADWSDLNHHHDFDSDCGNDDDDDDVNDGLLRERSLAWQS